MMREINSLQHPLVKHLVKLRQDGRHRAESCTVLIEGKTLIEEVGSYHHVKCLIATNAALIPKQIKADEVFIVSHDVMKKISGLHTPEGLAAEVNMPPQANLDGMHRILACDNVSDPGNLGTLLRTGLALGWEGVFLLPGGCDPFNDKVLRAAKGATFRMPIRFGTWDDLKKIAQKNHLTPLVADIRGTPVDDVKKGNGLLLVLSNETHGPSDEARNICECVTIPMNAKMESLNVSVAGGILMYVLGNNL